jgi:hypothetical protein
MSGGGAGGLSQPPIYYVVTARHAYTMGDYLLGWGKALADRIAIVSYPGLFSLEALPGGVYIFSDLERLSLAQRKIVAHLWDLMESAGPGFLLLNHPLRALQRYELLSTLHETGRNSFNAYGLDEIPRPLERAVFIRPSFEHEGSLTEPIAEEGELYEAIATLVMAGRQPAELLAVEYCETVDPEGIYRKYGALRIGDRLLPRLMAFSEQWVQQYPDLVEPDQMQEELRYLTTNPHEQALREVFELAHIDYGRIDYGIRDGRIQVWEINTNPIVMLPREKYSKAQLSAQVLFAAMAQEVFSALGADLPPREPVPVALPPDLMRRLLSECC